MIGPPAQSVIAPETAPRASHLRLLSSEWSIAVSRNQQQTNTRRRVRPASKGRGRTSARSGGGKRRWLVLPLALGIATLAFYVLVSGGRPAFLDPGEPPLDDIGDASRLRLEHVLGEAEREASDRP